LFANPISYSWGAQVCNAVSYDWAHKFAQACVMMDRFEKRFIILKTMKILSFPQNDSEEGRRI